jgi:hypothetical protein
MTKNFSGRPGSASAASPARLALSTFTPQAAVYHSRTQRIQPTPATFGPRHKLARKSNPAPPWRGKPEQPAPVRAIRGPAMPKPRALRQTAAQRKRADYEYVACLRLLTTEELTAELRKRETITSRFRRAALTEEARQRRKRGVF